MRNQPDNQRVHLPGFDFPENGLQKIFVRYSRNNGNIPAQKDGILNSKPQQYFLQLKITRNKILYATLL